MKLIFALIVVIHAFIHLIGFVKAYFSTEIFKQILGISKPIRALWLVTFILFIVTIVASLKNKKWFYSAFGAIFISQVLILTTWQDTKFGTIVNIIILNRSYFRF